VSKTSDAMISDLVGTFTDPIIVYPGGWGDTLPDWLKEAITLERLETNIKASKNDEPTGTNAESCAYLYTAGLTAPMDHDWSQIYLYAATQTYARHKGSQVPEGKRKTEASGGRQEKKPRHKERLNSLRYLNSENSEMRE